MYAARGPIQKRTGKPLNDDYFTQTLLPDFMAEHAELTRAWTVVYGGRGYFVEPHSGRRIELSTGTLQRDTRRYVFKNNINVIELGLRLTDVDAWKLESEKVSYGDQDKVALANNLRLNGATEEEIQFLIEKEQRVELNAFTSADLVKFVETKLDANGVANVIPTDDTVLARSYRRTCEDVFMEQRMAEIRQWARKHKDALCH